MPGIERRPIRGGVRFVVRVRNPANGRATSATFATEPEAQRFVRDVGDRGVAWALEEYARDKAEAQELTLDQWAEVHFSALTKANGSTVARYRRIYAAVWSPALGAMRLSRIDRVAVSIALNAVPGSDKTVKNAWGVLATMLKMAAQDGLISRSPAIGIGLPERSSHETEEHRYLTHDEFWNVLDATPTYWQPLVRLLGGSGIRWGELAALTVADIDTDNNLVRITKAEKQDPDKPSATIIGPPKTRKARRSVTLPRVEVVEPLYPLLDGRSGRARLFLPPKGGPLRHRTFYRDIWLKKSVGNSGIRDPHPR